MTLKQSMLITTASVLLLYVIPNGIAFVGNNITERLQQQANKSVDIANDGDAYRACVELTSEYNKDGLGAAWCSEFEYNK